MHWQDVRVKRKLTFFKPGILVFVVVAAAVAIVLLDALLESLE
jgi:hypothetical protein